MKKLFFMLFLCLGVFACSEAWAAQPAPSEASPEELVAPLSATVSPNGARLDVVQKATVRIVNGEPFVQFVLPPTAANLQLSIPGRTIARWSTTPVLLNDHSPLTGRRARVIRERTELSTRLMTVNARLGLWQAPPKNGNAQDVLNLQAAMQEEMPKLALEQAELERRLKLVNEELSRMPNISGLGERVRVMLAGDVEAGAEVTVNYSYNHDGCGWETVYDFNAKTGESVDTIDVRMIAEVWQYTGMDWKNTIVTLATKGFGPRQPAPLPEWIIESTPPRPRPQPRALNMVKAAPMMEEAAVTADGAVPAMAPVQVNTDTLYATFRLTESGLPQGRSRMQIAEGDWRAPLQWIARPSRGDSEVYLYAKYKLPPDQAWPAGLAEFSVNGQSVGSGEFRPRNGEANLYFGPDPRVNIITTTDSRRHGQSGIINTNKTWTWAWTYTITNEHNKAIKVRVERPEPQIVDEGVTVAYKNNPQATVDQKEHMLSWLVDVPAHGKKAIEHSVTITAPTKLPLSPDVP